MQILLKGEEEEEEEEEEERKKRHLTQTGHQSDRAV